MKEVSLKKVTDLLLDVICVVDAEGYFVFISGACERVFGYRPEELIGRNMIELVYPDDRERTLAVVDDIMTGQPIFHFENRYVRKDGRVVDIMWSAHWSKSDKLRLAVARDITELKRGARLKDALYKISQSAHSAEDLSALYQHVHETIADLLPLGNFIVVRYEESDDSIAWPYCADKSVRRLEQELLQDESAVREVIRARRPLLVGPAMGPDSATTNTAQAAKSENWLGVPLLAESGVIGALITESADRSVRFTEDDIELLRFVSTQVVSAIERKEAETRLRHLARHDPLTDLPNRVLVHDRFGLALKSARRDGTRVGLLYLDLDGFKRVNDTLGHDIGDELLRSVAKRLMQCVRESDTVGRLGGDEFVVLLNGMRSADCLDRVAAEIYTELEMPFEVSGHRLEITASVGTAVFPEHGDDWQGLFRRADAAMYAAKRRNADANRKRN